MVGFEAGGPWGAAIGASVGSIADGATKIKKAFEGVSDKATDAAKRLGQFNGTIALANAKAGVRQTFGDMGRANFLKPELSRFTDVQSKLSQQAQDVGALALKAGLKIIVPIMEKILEVIERLIEQGSEWAAGSLDGLADIQKDCAEILSFISGGFLGSEDAGKFLKGMAGDIREMARIAKKDAGQKWDGLDPFTRDFLNGGGMGLNLNNLPLGQMIAAPGQIGAGGLLAANAVNRLVAGGF
jgi:hypothetical protein